MQMTDLKFERDKKHGKTIYLDFAMLPVKTKLRVVR
jgi:hypothetical protein